MKIAIISDIHGNLPALEAALEDVRRLAPDQVIVDGDLVGRGPQSHACLEVIAATGWPVTLGNHEDFLVNCARGDVPADWEDGWWAPARLILSRLDAGWIDWMAALPFEHVIAVPGAPEILVVHGSPRRLNEGLHPVEPDEHILEALDGTPYPVVVGAHTHVPMDRCVGPYRVLNSASVGAPFNGDPAAQYLLLTWDGKAWAGETRRVDYDREATYRAWRETGLFESGVAMRVFAYELETATFHFWHYVDYCRERGLSLNAEASFAAYRREANGHAPSPGPGVG